MATAAAHAKPHHDYHLVNPSPWPAVGAVSALLLAIGAIAYMRSSQKGEDLVLFGFLHLSGPWLLFIGAAGVLYTMFAWWSDVVHESLTGDHTPVVKMHHRYGMMLFIASEVMFFVAWFWAYFDQFFRHDDTEQYARVDFMGATWPPHGVELFDPFHLPLFNTLLLLTSGTTVTWAHHALIHGDKRGLKFGLWLTIILGAMFTCVQAIECLPASRRSSTRALALPIPATSMARPSSWRLVSTASTCLSAPFSSQSACYAPIATTSRRSTTSASNSPPGTGTSSTWSGCSCSRPSMSGAAGASRSITADAVDLPPPFTGEGDQPTAGRGSRLRQGSPSH
jgi:heme/copper-type cytochrome/quinol oxidase subunit 3